MADISEISEMKDVIKNKNKAGSAYFAKETEKD